jgi:SAM-dependent methyltransferase
MQLQLDTLHDLMVAYRAAAIDRSIHPNDDMYNTGPEWYWGVGESAIDCIVSALLASPTAAVNSCLDFGCGYGRVARHLRAFFPAAKLYVTDVNEEAAQYCATTFGGEVIVAAPDPAQAHVPVAVDLVWVGSVFTHIDIGRMADALDRLLRAVNPTGVVVATTNGRRCLEMAKSRLYIDRGKWERIVAQYNSSGAGYQSYGRPDWGDWGVSLTSPGRIAELTDARMTLYQEGGWANHQDLVAWSRSS